MVTTPSPARIASVEAQDIRCYQYIHCPLALTWTLLCGPNGAGKTNFLELLTVNLRGTVLRGRVSHLLAWGADHGRIRTTLTTGHEFETTVTRAPQGVTKTRTFDGSALRPPDNVLPSLILFLPQEEELLSFPAGRRRLLSRGLALQSRTYARAVQQYAYVLRQRNALLRKSRTLPTDTLTQELTAWADAGIPLMILIWAERLMFLEYARREYARILAQIGGLEIPVTIDFMLGGFERGTVLPTADVLRERWQELREQEVCEGTTLLGPHRDDLQFLRNGDDILPFLSRGQKRAILVGFHLLEGVYAQHATSRGHIYLFDDVFSELDVLHRDALSRTLAHEQVVLTSADPRVNEHIPSSGRVIQIDQGEIQAPVGSPALSSVERARNAL